MLNPKKELKKPTQEDFEQLTKTLNDFGADVTEEDLMLAYEQFVLDWEEEQELARQALWN